MQILFAASTAPDFIVMLAGTEQDPENEKESETEEVEEVEAAFHVSHGDSVSRSGSVIPGDSPMQNS